MTTKLERLRGLSKRATSIPWSFFDGVMSSQYAPPVQVHPAYFCINGSVDADQFRESDANLIVEMRNNIDALLDIAEAARRAIGLNCQAGKHEDCRMCQLSQALSRLEDEV